MPTRRRHRSPSPAIGDAITLAQAAELLGYGRTYASMLLDCGHIAGSETAGGHRRFSRASVMRWVRGRDSPLPAGRAPADRAPLRAKSSAKRRAAGAD